MLKRLNTRGLARRLADRRGVAAVEFALIAPVMILLYFGLAELSSAITAARHTNQSSAALGDLVAQCSNMNDSDATNILAAATDILAPLPVATLQLRVSSVEQMTNDPTTTQVQWSSAPPGQATLVKYPQTTPITLPAGLTNNAGDTVIVSEAMYKFNFPIDLFNGLIKFDDLSYYKPRKSQQVSYTGPTANGGSGTGVSCYQS